MKNLQDYLVQLRERPGMYLGSNTITSLSNHLAGYRICLQLNNIKNPSDEHFFEHFGDFVDAYYEVHTQGGWKALILEQRFNKEEAALETFFELYDLFINEVKTDNPRKTVLAFFDKMIFKQEEMKSALGKNFPLVLANTMDLLKDNGFTNLKYDYDYILEQIKEQSYQMPELNVVLKAIEVQTE